MRKALNENTTVQIAVLAVLALAGGILLLSTMGKKSGGSSTPSAASSAAPVGTAPAATAAAVPAAQPAAVSPLEAGPGLPQAVMTDYSSGKTVVLLIFRPGGIDDKLVSQAASQLRGRGDVAFFSTSAKHIARYSRITAGVGVSQVPALVVVSPRKVSGEAPKATVSYGFRSGDSIAQAVRDAEYNGPSVGYDPG
jgi:hypothetical protein